MDVVSWSRKLLHGKESKEPDEFVANYNKILLAHKKLISIQASLKKWLKQARTMSKVATELGVSLGGDIQSANSIRHETEVLLGNDLVVAVAKKIAELKDLERRRYRLECMRLERDQRRRNMEAFKRKLEKHKQKGGEETPEHKKSEEKYTTLFNAASKEYDDQLRDLTPAIEYTAREAVSHDELGLIWTEITAFRNAQFQVYLKCQQVTLLRGDEGNTEEVETKWKSFNHKSPILPPTSASMSTSSKTISVSAAAAATPPPPPPPASTSPTAAVPAKPMKPTSVRAEAAIAVTKSPGSEREIALPPPPPPGMNSAPPPPSTTTTATTESEKKKSVSINTDKKGILESDSSGQSGPDMTPIVQTEEPVPIFGGSSQSRGGSFTLKAPVNDDDDEESAEHANALQMALEKIGRKKLGEE